jgi:hypothetical protein
MWCQTHSTALVLRNRGAHQETIFLAIKKKGGPPEGKEATPILL